MECSSCFPSFVHFEWVLGLFWANQKNAFLAQKMRSFGRAPPDLAPPPQGATVEFLAQTLDLARLNERSAIAAPASPWAFHIPSPIPRADAVPCLRSVALWPSVFHLIHFQWHMRTV